MEEPSHPVFETGAEDQPIIHTSQHPEWFSQPRRPPSPDRDWNKTLPAAQGNAQSWISELARQTDARSLFNELLDTPIDFSNFIMNRLGVDTLTPELLAGPTYELMRGSCNSLTELEYHLEEVYKATMDQLDWVNPEGQQYPHNLLQPLPLIPDNRGRRIREEIREEFRTGSGSSNAGGNPPPVTIHTGLERFNKQKPHSFEKATVPVNAENWISHMEKVFDVMGCEDDFKTRLAVYKFEGNALAWWKAYKQAKGGDAWLERWKREYHSIRQTSLETSTEFMQRFLRLVGFLGAAAGTEEEQAKNFQALEFQPGDHVFLKVSPARGFRRFGIKGKLSPRFIGPFEILDRVEEPEAIIDCQYRIMRKKTIPFVKILWRNHPEREATWETEESIRTSYPHFLP
nr:hypothetical protein [Tanacetum cinerariifolium]